MLVRTSVFSIYSTGEDTQDREQALARLNCNVESSQNTLPRNSLRKHLKHNIERHGYTVLENIFCDDSLARAKKTIRDFVQRQLLPCYDSLDDSFDGFDAEAQNITRMPRIGDGKHNIHFDPEFSQEHRVLADLIESSPLLSCLSHYMDAPCALRESGISVTRPRSEELGNDTESLTSARDGRPQRRYIQCADRRSQMMFLKPTHAIL